MFYQDTFVSEQREWMNTTLPVQQSAGLHDVYCPLRSPEISGEVWKYLDHNAKPSTWKRSKIQSQVQASQVCSIGGNWAFDRWGEKDTKGE